MADETKTETEKPELSPLEAALAEERDAASELLQAKDLLDKAAERYSKAAVAVVHAQGGTENPPLHELNRRQAELTRIEQLQRQKALEAFRLLKELHGPLIAPSKPHPLHPAAAAAAGTARSQLEG